MTDPALPSLTQSQSALPSPPFSLSALASLLSGFVIVILAIAMRIAYPTLPDSYGLTLLGVGALLIIIGSITLTARALALQNMADAQEALALPHGSVRALIALALILMFATFSMFVVTTAKDPTAVNVDLAKQIVTILGTLVTAISSFYFGARSTSSGVSLGQDKQDN